MTDTKVSRYRPGDLILCPYPLDVFECIDQVHLLGPWTIVPSWTPIVVLSTGTYASLDHVRILVGTTVAYVAERDIEHFVGHSV